MERWEGKVAIVTGASIGVGPTIIKTLAEKQMKVVALSRLTHRLHDLAATVTTPGQIIPVKCDIAKEDDILKTFNWITERVGPVNVLINNASLSRNTTLLDGATKEWRRIYDINVIALCICTREAIRIMKRYSIAGHIIHMNSIAGHKVPNIAEPTLNVYPSSKFAVTALTESLRQELSLSGSRIKVTSISPGLVQEENQDGYDKIPYLEPNDIAEAIIYVLSTGPNVQVLPTNKK